MSTVRIPVNTNGGHPLSPSPTFRDLADYIHARLVAERIISRWDRAVHHSGTSILIQSPSRLPAHIVEWAESAAREFYAPLHVGNAVQEEPSGIARAIAVATGIAVAPVSPITKTDTVTA
ncbi:hypothetical protein CcaverHIS002_0410140 [Cutaneotrichosporon cavernicola]|uniref:Uncharacterized protein n=1 Tax=Cutaneotrichosporon cavernicola TaxID=279322 RepID=A0AA48L565_9TREE|nr:uncharacterized protein CcaverHIS019_0410040 [Cutaneotrichosporon cavernicola]BEI84410.1 hypothetical protein CcaverHIS002_0410140 [Cutaneotrichosporon cavernicola]BEI92184.1 hypothetical protein CcaverHIS019_0410040 [Cutaneotrichosporon cavernicola]BEI99955.1 hypothetical protein CcaverHIS631_0409980 [Cutaneotrichosporon cavernicola]BEJ07729.1 hypothetical protein CcaverHIS641_0409980 [Cutaneotrichosporon cavernicola]